MLEHKDATSQLKKTRPFVRMDFPGPDLACHRDT